MPRDANIPDAFDVYTLVILRRPPDAPEMSEEQLDELQARHLAYRAELSRQGILVVNEPLAERSRTRRSQSATAGRCPTNDVVP
jgi:hypothetical protein